MMSTEIPSQSTSRNELVTPYTKIQDHHSISAITGKDYGLNNSVIGTQTGRIVIFALPVFILILLIPLIIFIIKQKQRKNPEEGYPAEKKNEDVKSPIFEEDTPSVMEIEMEELDKWMDDMKKNDNRLSAVEEENKLHISTL